jgi:hypothetical protein
VSIGGAFGNLQAAAGQSRSIKRRALYVVGEDAVNAVLARLLSPSGATIALPSDDPPEAILRSAR